MKAHVCSVFTYLYDAGVFYMCLCISVQIHILTPQVGWSEERFVDIITKLRLFLKQAGFKVSDHDVHILYK